MKVRLTFAASAIAVTGVILVALAAWALPTLWRAGKALEDSAQQAADSLELPFQRGRVAPPANAFEPLPSLPEFTDVALFDGAMYLSAAAGLFRYSTGGELERVYRPGRELPPAPLQRLAVGLDPETQTPCLFAATDGEGLLLLRRGAAPEQLLPEDPEARRITAILPLDTGSVLLGTLRTGVLTYDGESLERLRPEWAEAPITALAGEAADLWAGTRDRGVLRLRGGAVAAFDEADGLADRQVLAIETAGEGVYVGGPVGVAAFRNGRFDRTLADGSFAQALTVSGDELLLGSLDEEIAAVPLGATRRRAVRPTAGGPTDVRRLVELQGEVYAVARHGLFRRQGDRWRRVIETDAGLLHVRNITALDCDADGRLWAGSFDNGLDIVSLGERSVRHIEDETVFCINRIGADPERDRMIVGAANGLIFFDMDGQKRGVLRQKDGLLSNHITDFLAEPSGLTVGTGAGVTFLEGGAARSLYAFHGLVNNHVYSLARYGDQLYAGTLGGLSVIAGNVVRASYTVADSPLPHNWITAMAPFQDGVFLGSYGGGVVFRTESSWRSWPELAGVEINPNAMAATAARLYAGTLDRGLLVYEAAGDRWSFVASGLPSRNVTALEASAGRLTIGTENGIVRIAESALVLP